MHPIIKHDSSGKWLFGRVNDSYVGIHRHCVSEFEDNFAYCYDQKQVWLSIVGHADTHGSFSNFISIAETSDIKQDLAGMCVQASASIDGKELGISFCRNMGKFITYLRLRVIVGGLSINYRSYFYFYCIVVRFGCWVFRLLFCLL